MRHFFWIFVLYLNSPNLASADEVPPFVSRCEMFGKKDAYQLTFPGQGRVLRDGQLFINLNGGFRRLFTPHEIHAHVLSADKQRLYLHSNTETHDAQLSVWDTATGQNIARYSENNYGPAHAPRGPAAEHSLSPDGKYWLLHSQGRLSVINLDTGEAVSSFVSDLTTQLRTLDFSPDSQSVLLADTSHHLSSRPYAVRMFHISTGEIIGDPILLERPIQAAEFSADGNFILVKHGTENTTEAQLWSVPFLKGRLPYVRKLVLPSTVVFNEDRTQLVYLNDAHFQHALDLSRDLGLALPKLRDPKQWPLTKFFLFSPNDSDRR